MKAVWGVAYKAACGVCLVWLAVVLGVAVHYGWRALVADTFVIPSDSMSPTLLPGDKVRVDKTVFGARALHVAGLYGRADGEHPHTGASRPALQRHRGVQLSGE